MAEQYGAPNTISRDAKIPLSFFKKAPIRPFNATSMLQIRQARMVSPVSFFKIGCANAYTFFKGTVPLLFYGVSITVFTLIYTIGKEPATGWETSGAYGPSRTGHRITLLKQGKNPFDQANWAGRGH
eukprot:CAMPEP_0168528678 /NCGR_PEP_ID=MMETSP0405-20121227/13398_1 /TAXON_ID=498012 /ORGANISM="Trichosphaerium sp, Strain Am-I-7 wt" /LENGTH=126 /DNA_ID=CAMNT_0008552141 /DNA_START=16 /DNA_END=396 /DNA_ORIENTATION=+